MQLTDFIKIFTLLIGFLAFVYLLAWVFQGGTEEDERGRRALLPRIGRRKTRK